MWFIGVEVEQEKSAPPPKKNPGSAPEIKCDCYMESKTQYLAYLITEMSKQFLVEFELL